MKSGSGQAEENDAAVPLVDIQGVTKRFGNHVAIDNVSLDLRSGRFVTLLGPSGCGKTTLLRMIGNLETPDSGQILISGRPTASYRASTRPTRMVFQSYALFPHMTVSDNVGYGLRMRGLAPAKIRAQVAEQLDVVGLPEKAAAYPGELSGGQQQRVALARALVTQPQVLLLDEPLAALDLKLRQRMQEELKALQRAAGIAFIYVTHDQHEALALSDEVVVMHAGRVAQRDTPDNIYRRPASRYVAEFVGDATLVPGKVKWARQGEACVETPLGEVNASAVDESLIAGDAVTAVIRPEDVILGRGEANNFSGIVRETTYRGMDLLADLQVGTTALRMSVPGSQGASVRRGAVAEVNLRAQALWLINNNGNNKE